MNIIDKINNAIEERIIIRSTENISPSSTTSVTLNKNIDVIIMHPKGAIALHREQLIIYKSNYDNLYFINRYGRKMRVIKSFDMKEEEILVY